MEAEIARYLESRIPADSVTVSHLTRIPGGASRETFMFKAVWREGGARRAGQFVLRRDPPASLIDSDRAVEFAFYAALEGTPVPVPRVRWLEPEGAGLGSPFFVMDRVTGGDTNTRRILEPAYDAGRATIGRRMYEILADLHAVDWRATGIARVADCPAPEDCWRRELDAWERVIDMRELRPQPIARAAIRWLRVNPPAPPPRIVVVHGDYRVGNVVYSRDDVIGVLDFELAHLGDPLEDLAWSFMESWEWARDGRKGGIIAREDAITAYEARAGYTIDREALHWWEVFSGVKGQALWLSGARTYQEGLSQELMLPLTAYWLTNFQDEIILRALGRDA